MQQIQLRDAKARLSALVEAAADGHAAVITRHGKPRAVIIGVDEWDRLRRVPSFGSLLCSMPIVDDDVFERIHTPPRDTGL